MARGWLRVRMRRIEVNALEAAGCLLNYHRAAHERMEGAVVEVGARLGERRGERRVWTWGAGVPFVAGVTGRGMGNRIRVGPGDRLPGRDGDGRRHEGEPGDAHSDSLSLRSRGSRSGHLRRRRRLRWRR